MRSRRDRAQVTVPDGCGEDQEGTIRSRDLVQDAAMDGRCQDQGETRDPRDRARDAAIMEGARHASEAAGTKKEGGSAEPVTLYYAYAPSGTSPREMSHAAWQLTLEAVSREKGVSRKELTRAEGPSGKPYFKHHPEICFNISHSGRCIACALAGGPVGVDVQVRTGRDPSKVARRVFNEETYAAYLSASDREDFFYTHWARLESRLKRTGEGFTVPLDKVNMDGWFSFPEIGENYYAAVNTSSEHDLILRKLDWESAWTETQGP